MGNRRRRAIGPNHNFWFSSGWILPRCDHGRGLYPCSPGSGGWWVPFGWWRVLAIVGAILSLVLMVSFFGATKLVPMALDLVVLWAAITNWLSAPPT